MEIEYRNNKLKKICTNNSAARKQYGQRMADLIHQRIQEIRAFDTVEELIQYGIGRCHPLKGNRQGQYALDLEQPHRLTFTVKHDIVQIAYIEEIVKDYH